MGIIVEDFKNGEPAPTAMDIKKRTGLPMRSINMIIYDLLRIHFLAEIVHDEKGDTAKYLPAEDIANLTDDCLHDRLADLGERL